MLTFLVKMSGVGVAFLLNPAMDQMTLPAALSLFRKTILRNFDKGTSINDVPILGR